MPRCISVDETAENITVTLTGLIVVSLHHSQVHGWCWLGYSSLTLRGVTFGPIGANTHFFYAGELRGATGDVHWVGDTCGHKKRSRQDMLTLHTTVYSKPVNTAARKSNVQFSGFML